MACQCGNTASAPSLAARDPPQGMIVKTIERTALVAILTFASGMVGFLIQWLPPVQHVVDSKGAIGSVVGLITLLLARV